MWQQLLSEECEISLLLLTNVLQCLKTLHYGIPFNIAHTKAEQSVFWSVIQTPFVRAAETLTNVFRHCNVAEIEILNSAFESQYLHFH